MPGFKFMIDQFFISKFFHPDPTVKRQSGFLIPTLADLGNTGIINCSLF